MNYYQFSLFREPPPKSPYFTLPSAGYFLTREQFRAAQRARRAPTAIDRLIADVENMSEESTTQFLLTLLMYSDFKPDYDAMAKAYNLPNGYPVYRCLGAIAEKHNFDLNGNKLTANHLGHTNYGSSVSGPRSNGLRPSNPAPPAPPRTSMPQRTTYASPSAPSGIIRRQPVRPLSNDRMFANRNAVHQYAAQQPVVRQPTIHQPTVHQPTIHQPTVHQYRDTSIESRMADARAAIQAELVARKVTEEDVEKLAASLGDIHRRQN